MCLDASGRSEGGRVDTARRRHARHTAGWAFRKSPTNVAHGWHHATKPWRMKGLGMRSRRTPMHFALPATLLLTSCSGQPQDTSVKAISPTNTARTYIAPPRPLYHEIVGADQPSSVPMLMIHGFGENTYTWGQVVPQLANERQLILLDLKGFGRSPKPTDTSYSPLDQADLLYNFIVEKQLSSLILVGHSFGGGVALLVALRLLESGDDRLKALVLIDSIAYNQSFPYFIKLLRTPFIRNLAVSVLSPEFQVKRILEHAYFDDRKIRAGQIKAYADPIRSPGGRHALLETARQIIPDDLDAIAARYKRILVPTLLIWGKEDRIVP